MSRTMTRDLTAGNPMKLMVSFAAPLLFGVLFQQLYSFVDTAIVGRYLGASKLAAVCATGSAERMRKNIEASLQPLCAADVRYLETGD